MPEETNVIDTTTPVVAVEETTTDAPVATEEVTETTEAAIEEAPVAQVE